MADESRTGRCLRNGAYSASLLVVNIILGFVARGVFIRHVGVEFLGLNTSVEGILGLLNVAELGVSYAIASSLYGPMASGDKVAVAEETVRLHSHIAQFRDMVAKGGVIGRKLDFLIQEMNRETNTTGSKCNDLALSTIVVDMKAELEKIREQVQNVE